MTTEYLISQPMVRCKIRRKWGILHCIRSRICNRKKTKNNHLSCHCIRTRHCKTTTLGISTKTKTKRKILHCNNDLSCHRIRTRHCKTTTLGILTKTKTKRKILHCNNHLSCHCICTHHCKTTTLGISTKMKTKRKILRKELFTGGRLDVLLSIPRRMY